MTWQQFTTFLWGSAVVIVDSIVGPIYRWLHDGSRR